MVTVPDGYTATADSTGLNITLTHTPEKTSVTGTVNWDDESEAHYEYNSLGELIRSWYGIERVDVFMQLLINGKPYGEPIEIPASGYEQEDGKAISAVKANTPTPVSGSFDQPSVGTCPKCGKKVFDTPKAYSCSGGRDGCGFIIWKTIAGKSISSTQAEKLISSGRTGLIKGFKAKSGNDFDAYLVLRDDKTIGFEFPKRKKK